MQMWDGFGWGFAFWPMIFFMGIPILFLVGVVVLIILLTRSGGAGSEQAARGTPAPRAGEDTAVRILRERYARGEIDEEEFRQRRRELESPET